MNKRIDKMTRNNSLPAATERNDKAFAKFTKSLDSTSSAMDTLSGASQLMTSEMVKANVEMMRSDKIMHDVKRRAYDMRTGIVESSRAVRDLGASFDLGNKSSGRFGKAIGFVRDEHGKSRAQIDSHGSSLQRFVRELAQANETASQYGRAIKDVKDFSFFRTGFMMGTRFWQVSTLIAAILPVIGTAAAGLGGMINALAGGFVMLGQSAGRAAGALAVIPGILGAIGVAQLGIRGIMSGILQPAMNGQKELVALAGQIASARSAVTTAKTIEERSAAQAQLNLLTKDYNNLLARTPKNAQKLVDGVDELKNTWYAVWQGEGRADIAINTAVKVMQQLQRFIYGIQPGIRSVFQVIQFIASDLGDALASGPVQQFFNVAL